MKQGRAPSVQSAHKREPIIHKVDPGAVADIGIKEVRTGPQPLYMGRGANAPMSATTVHPRGSQGKHK